MDERAYEAKGVLVVPWRVCTLGFPTVHENEIIELLTPEEFAALPDGTTLICINGEEAIVGQDEIDLDTRAGRIAWGLPDRRNTQ